MSTLSQGHSLSKISWYYEPLTLPFTRTKELKPTLTKELPRTIIHFASNFALDIVEIGKYCSLGNGKNQATIFFLQNASLEAI